MKYMFLVIMAAYIGGNAYMFVRALQMFSRLLASYSPAVNLLCKAAFTMLFWLCASLIFISLFTRDIDYPAFISGAMYLIGSVWMVFTLYMVLSLLVVDISKLILSLFDNIKLLLPLSKNGFVYALGFTCCLLIYGYINYRTPQVNKIEINLNKPLISNFYPGSLNNNAAKLKKECNGRTADSISATTEKRVKIAAVSDIHLGNGTGKKQLQKYVNLINSQKPDVILIGGDLIDNSLQPLYRENMAEELNRLEAPFGIYMVPGNHEYISGIAASGKFLANTKITLLRDSVVTLPCGIQIIGRDDRSNRSRCSLEELLIQAQNKTPLMPETSCLNNSKMPVILLDHQPYELAKADSLGIDLQFYGHTHRGQVWPLNWLTDRIYEQSHGYRKWNNSHIYVSSGLSLWGPPFRIGTRSDLALFTIR